MEFGAGDDVEGGTGIDVEAFIVGTVDVFRVDDVPLADADALIAGETGIGDVIVLTQGFFAVGIVDHGAGVFAAIGFHTGEVDLSAVVEGDDGFVVYSDPGELGEGLVAMIGNGHAGVTGGVKEAGAVLVIADGLSVAVVEGYIDVDGFDGEATVEWSAWIGGGRRRQSGMRCQEEGEEEEGSEEFFHGEVSFREIKASGVRFQEAGSRRQEAGVDMCLRHKREGGLFFLRRGTKKCCPAITDSTKIESIM